MKVSPEQLCGHEHRTVVWLEFTRTARDQKQRYVSGVPARKGQLRFAIESYGIYGR